MSLSVSAPEVKPVITPSVTVASLFEQYEAEKKEMLLAMEYLLNKLENNQNYSSENIANTQQ